MSASSSSSVVSSSSMSLCDVMFEIMEQKRPKNMYGDRTKFQSLKEQAINETALMIAQMKTMPKPTNPQDPTNYQAVLTKAGQLRNNIAVETGTDKAESFGVIRKGERNSSHDMFVTPLQDETYRQLNDNIKNLMVSCLQKNKNKATPAEFTSGNATYTLSFKRYDTNILNQLLEHKNILDAAINIDREEASGNHNRIYETMAANEFAEDYLKTHRALLTQINLHNKVPKEQATPDENFYTCIGRMEVNVDNHRRTLTRHISVITCKPNGKIQNSDIEKFKLHALSVILHTNSADFKYFTPSMAETFNKIIYGNTTKEELQPLITSFERRLHHLCYFERGSAAINEIILEAIKKEICPTYVLKGNLATLADPFAI